MDDFYELVQQHLMGFIDQHKQDWAQTIAATIDDMVSDVLRAKVREAVWTAASRWADANRPQLDQFSDQAVNRAAADLLLAYERTANPEKKHTA